jgi:hypothetical protein
MIKGLHVALVDLERELTVVLRQLSQAHEQHRCFVVVECAVNRKWFVQFYGSQQEGIFLDIPSPMIADAKRSEALPTPTAQSPYACQWQCVPDIGAAWAATIFRRAYELPEHADLVVRFESTVDGEAN